MTPQQRAVADTMRALVVETAGNWSIETVDTPEINDIDDVLVEVKNVSICGTDPKIFHGDVEGWPPSFPFIPGHEWAGEVVEVGDGVERLAPGDHVFAESHHGCGFCQRCREGQYNLCENYGNFESGHRQIGHTSNGAYAEFAAVPADTLHHLPEELSWREGALLDVNAIALHLAERGNIDAGDTVAVIGTGTVGLLAVQIAKAKGASEVVGVGNPRRNELAAALGTDHTVSYKDDDVIDQVMDLTDCMGVDVALEAAGSGTSFEQAVAVTRKGGTVSLDGIPSENMQSVPMADLVTDEIEFRGCRAHANKAQASARLVRKGQVEVDSLFTHEFAFEDFDEAYETFTERKEDAIKVVLTL